MACNGTRLEQWNAPGTTETLIRVFQRTGNYRSFSENPYQSIRCSGVVPLFRCSDSQCFTHAIVFLKLENTNYLQSRKTALGMEHLIFDKWLQNSISKINNYALITMRNETNITLSLLN